MLCLYGLNDKTGEPSGSVVECLTQDQGLQVCSLSLSEAATLCPGARHFIPCLVLVQPRKTCPNMTENCRLGCKESIQKSTIIMQSISPHGFRHQECKPVCHQGCIHGTCIEPDTCRCRFGFVGKNCSTECDCNGHSNCESVEKKDVCLECRNHTQVSENIRSCIT